MERLRTMDAETLLNSPLPKPEYLIDGLLPRGLSLLGGASKSGKSWLVLLFALHIAEGSPVWDIPTHRCEVLYISLEDTFSRLQERVYRLTDEPDPGLRFSVNCAKIGLGLEEQIEDELAEHPDTGLIIIDTLQKIRDTASEVRSGMYAADYNTMAALKTLADELGIGILLVHHVRKQPDQSDPFNMLSGSSAIMGAADTVLLLRRSVRGSQMASLLVTGRDLDDQELWLEREDCIWKLTQRQTAQQMAEESSTAYLLRIPALMQNRSAWRGTATELLEALGEKNVSPRAVRKHLTQNYMEVLFPAGISYQSHRTAKGRLILLYRYDGNDENDDPAHVPETPDSVIFPDSEIPSLPSLSSLNEQTKEDRT